MTDETLKSLLELSLFFAMGVVGISWLVEGAAVATKAVSGYVKNESAKLESITGRSMFVGVLFTGSAFMIQGAIEHLIRAAS